MISPMIKYSFLIYHREYEDFLDDLCELGVVHIKERDLDVSEEIREKYQYIDRVDKAIQFLKVREKDHPVIGGHLYGKDVFEEIVELRSQSEGVMNKLNSLRKEIHELFPWGNFSPDMIDKLRKEGVIIRFFVCPVRKFEQEWKEQYTIEEINVHGGQKHFVVITREGEDVSIPAEEFIPSGRSLASLCKEKDGVKEEIGVIERRYEEMARMDLDALEDYKNELIQELEYEKANHNTSREADDKLMILEGWVPQEKVDKVNHFIENSGVACITSEPAEGEKIPVKLINNKFSQKFEKIGELYTLPDYKELDVTPFFAPFYALFFGFCLGDAGYGILLVTAAIIARFKVRKEFKPLAVLVSYLGMATILFGIISGVFFGILLYETNLPVYRDLSAMLAERGTDINMILFYLAIVLGAVQIIFGMILKAANETIQFGWKFAVGTYGWLTLILGSLLLYLVSVATGISMERLMPVMYTILVVSGIMILFLNNLYRNMLTNFGLGLWNTYNMATGLLGDLLSYIRLFALGISSAILGLVFNTMAVSMSGNIPVISIIIMVFILAFGHGINLFMSGLGSFVHPLRLTFVEFYKNAGFTGGGIKYSPFRKTN
ncbi:MAG: hypothetical protein EA408_05230 [Marinilabiliales bacterium]|nr:MAG: hypothetical protein EA408_05230 [Marinilabiliales bacterium]